MLSNGLKNLAIHQCHTLNRVPWEDDYTRGTALNNPATEYIAQMTDKAMVLLLDKMVHLRVYIHARLLSVRRTRHIL